MLGGTRWAEKPRFLPFSLLVPCTKVSEAFNKVDYNEASLVPISVPGDQVLEKVKLQFQ